MSAWASWSPDTGSTVTVTAAGGGGGGTAAAAIHRGRDVRRSRAPTAPEEPPAIVAVGVTGSLIGGGGAAGASSTFAAGGRSMARLRSPAASGATVLGSVPSVSTGVFSVEAGGAIVAVAVSGVSAAFGVSAGIEASLRRLSVPLDRADDGVRSNGGRGEGCWRVSSRTTRSVASSTTDGTNEHAGASLSCLVDFSSGTTGR